jgi:signal transduction histidine kinase
MRERLHDLVLALFVTVMQVQGTMTKVAGQTEPVLRDLDPLAYALLIISGATLLVRRRFPVAVFATTAATSLVYYFLDYPDGPGWLALFVALYTMTAQGDGRRDLLIAGTGIAILAPCWLIFAADAEPRAAIGWVFFRIGASVMSAALGESVRSRRVIADQQARSRVAAERLRIAREVHDTVAHAIAIINVQSGVTAHVLDKRPEKAREALRVIEQTSSRALQEMRAILGVLRDTDDSRAPQPGIGQIGDLTAKAREAGLDVEERIEEAPGMPATVGATVYRIVQESLTNVLRHAGATRVTVAVDYDLDSVRVRVTDQGRGITGMRERSELLGGELEAGPLPDGGFEVSARLPLSGA